MRYMRIIAITLLLFSAASAFDTFVSIGKERKAAEPPACPATFTDSLESDGIARDFRHGVKAPKPTVMPAAEFSDKARREGRKNHINHFVSVVSMVIGVDGVPREVCLMKAAGYDLDAKAGEAAWKYRFVPASKDGEPVASRVTMEVSFSLR